ncbi:MAG: hypothetical protein WKF77_11315 [Planctomycetaceae bacterium]
MFRITMIAVVLAFQSDAFAQDTLHLTNSTGNKIIMKYLPRNERTNPMRVLEIPKDSKVSLPLEGEDPYDVTIQISAEVGRPNFQAKLGPINGVPLRMLAQSGQPLDIRLTLAQKQRNGQRLSQVMSATFISQANGDETNVVTDPGDGTDLSGEVIGRQWETEFVAGNGQLNSATIDFENLLFTTPQFTGTFDDLTILEDEAGALIVGRWAALSSKGDFYFRIEKADLTVLKGEYSFDGKSERLNWSSK